MAGNNSGSGFNFSGFEANTSFPSTNDAQWAYPVDELVSLRDEIGQVREEKLELRVQLSSLVERLQAAERKEASASMRAAKALAAEAIARSLVESLRRDFAVENQRAMDAYDRGVQLEEEVKQKQQTIDQQRRALADLQSDHDNATAHLLQQEQHVAQKDGELASLRDAVERLRQDVHDEQQHSASLASELQQAHEAMRHAQVVHDNVLRARDEAAEVQHGIEQQFNALHAEYEQAQQHIAQLEEQIHQAEEVMTANQALETEMDTIRADLEDRDRTLIVKDERISQLETQFQKERQRSLHHEAAAARTAAASPVNEPPEPAFNIADSLEEELNTAFDYEESIYEHLDFSDVHHIIHVAPVAPAAPTFTPSTVHVTEAASVAPVVARVPALTLAVNQVTSIAPIAPIERQIQNSTTSTQTDAPTLDFTIHEIASIAPVQQHVTSAVAATTQTDAHELTFEILDHATFAITPISPVEPPAQLEVLSSHTATQTDAPEAPKLTASVIDTASINITPIEAPKTEPIPTLVPIQTASPPQKISITPINVTFEEEPVAQPAEKQPKDIVAPQPTVTNKVSTFQATLPLLAGLLILLCLYLYTEVHAWRTANGVGFGNGYGNVYDRSGAFGNGRRLFGIPLAMDIGNSDLSENIAKTMSVAITRFEDWAGISQRVLY